MPVVGVLLFMMSLLGVTKHCTGHIDLTGTKYARLGVLGLGLGLMI